MPLGVIFHAGLKILTICAAVTKKYHKKQNSFHQDPPYSPQGINVEISVVTHSDEVAVGCLTDASSSITSHVKVVVMYNGSSTAQLVSTIISKILEDIAEYFNTRYVPYLLYQWWLAVLVHSCN